MEHILAFYEAHFMIFNQRHLFVYRDWLSCLFTTMLACIGLASIFSATYRPEQPFSIFFIKQIGGLLVGLLMYGVISCIDYRVMLRWGYCAYWCVLIMLVFTLFKGTIGMGGQRWISLGFFKVQPSELAKLFFPAYAVYHLYGDPMHPIPTSKTYASVIVVLIISVLLIRKQPDLGTALIILFSGLAMLWLAGLSRRFFIVSFLLVAISAPLTWSLLKEYQKQRIYVFLGYGQTHKERYQIEQSKIAIGSGGLLGKGFLQGTQNQLHFLPEGRTDFIFSVIAEEWGFIGSLCVLFVYLVLMLHLLGMASPIADPGTKLLALGLLIPIIFSALINICMVIGLLPVVGIPLPLVSYGLSNLWTTLASLGWFQSIAMHRFHLQDRTSNAYKNPLRV